MGVVSMVFGVGTVTDLCDEVIELGDLHPSSHGALRLRVETQDGIITAAEAMPGLLHRGAEKLMEARDYRQVLMLASRHDWLAAFCSEVGAALAVEELLGLEVPERATWVRTLLSELTRVAAGAAFLATAPLADAPPPPATTGLLRLREQILGVIEDYTGARIHPMITRVGGLAAEPPIEWFDAVERLCEQGRASIAAWLDADLPALAEAGRGIATLATADAIAYAASGPVGRASGVPLDLRRDDPYLAYAELRDVWPTREELDALTDGVDRLVDRPPAGTEGGDAAARFAALASDVAMGLELAQRCTHAARPLRGPVNVRLPKVVRAPEGHTYTWTENPVGINGYLLVSTGGPAPWRMKMRTASFAHAAALAAALPGTPVTGLPIALASFFLLAGDIDR